MLDAGIIRVFVVSILVPQKLVLAETLLHEGRPNKIRGTQKKIGGAILLFFFREYLGLIRVFIVWRKNHIQPFRLLLHRFVRISGMSVGPLQDCSNSESRG